ncbi:hypothetical protein TWF481_002866 [Arthrobotrys musiformis]|uniref:Uncharacterized protein n=1 Tax=Arthrobotrys musiformis TaxID=47236 RepID=A0AAV9VXL0_9PEZI
MVESYKTFTNPEVMAARVAGKAIPDFGFLEGCAIRFLSSKGFFTEFSDNPYFFQNPQLLLSGKGCTKLLGFAVSGSLSLRYLAAGSPKVWYVLNPKDKKGVNRFMSRHFGHRSAGFYTPNLPNYPQCEQHQEMAPIKDFIRRRKHLLEEYSTRDLLAGELDLRARARDNEQLQEPDEPGQLEPALSDVE